MLSYACGHCGHLVFFENTVRLHCSTPLGFVPEELALVGLEGRSTLSIGAWVAGTCTRSRWLQR